MRIASTVPLPFALCGLLAAGVLQPASRERTHDEPAPTLRLPDTAQPIRYRASLEIDPAAATFRGRVEIDVCVRRATGVLWINGQDLTIERAVLRRGGTDTLLRANALPRNFISLSTGDGIAAGEATLLIDYVGVQSVGIHGLRRHRDAGDDYIVTHFEPIGARRVFPSFDEPAFKVPWQLELTVPPGNAAFANTVATATHVLADGRTRVEFAPTAPLPSYLIAVAVGPFDTVDAGVSRGGVAMRIIVPRGRGADARYAAGEVGKVLAALEDYTGIPYPYDKLDHIVVPGAANEGAMEHPGLITYGPPWLLVRDGESAAAKRFHVEIVAHELAHQWFGNLVTSAWWDDLWLNEAFATWLAPKILEVDHPEMDGAIEPALIRQGALAADALTTARKIRQPIVVEADMRGAFDGITYSKGGSVVRMFEHWIGPAVFQRAAQRYLAAHAHGTATATDFLAALDGETGKPVSAAFATFLDQPGVPLIDMTVRCDARGATLTLDQRRYAASAGGDTALWQVPVCVRVPGEREPRCTLLAERTGELALGDACPAWIVPNVGGVGYYLSRLPAEALARLLDTGWSELSRVERIALVGDLRMLVDGGHADLDVLLALLPRLGASDDPYLTQIVVERLARLSTLVTDAQRDRFARLVRDLIGAHGERLAWTPRADDAVADAQLRGWLMAVLAIHGNEPAARTRATALARAWLDDTRAVPESLWIYVLVTAIQASPQEMFHAFVDRIARDDDRLANAAMYFALREVPERDLQARALGLLLDGAPITTEKTALLRSTAQSIDQQSTRFEFLRAHRDDLARRLPSDLRGALIATVCDASRRDEVLAYLTTLQQYPEIGPRAIEQAIEHMDQCVRRRAAQAPVLERFLDAHPPQPG